MGPCCGPGGGIGLAAVDVASSMGARVVACGSSTEKLGLAEAAGATATISYVEWGAWIGRFSDENAVKTADMLSIVAAGTITPMEPEVRPLDDALTSLGDLQGRRAAGKVVVVP